jgi:uncharacterized protein
VRELLLPVAVGLVSGVLAGMFGIGGGLITTPAIRLILGAPALIALGTPLPVIIPTAISGAYGHWRHGSADIRAGIVIGLCGAPLAVLGAWLSDLLGGTVMMLLTAALLGYVAVDTVLAMRRDEPAEALDGAVDGDAGLPRPHVPLRKLVVTGVVSGLYSGLLGLGGGFVIIPLLSRWGRVPFKLAIGTSLVAVSILAIPGTVAHAYLGHVDWVIAAGLAIGGVPGAAIGAHLSTRSSTRSIRIGFAVLLVLAAVWLAASELWGLVR